MSASTTRPAARIDFADPFRLIELGTALKTAHSLETIPDSKLYDPTTNMKETLAGHGENLREAMPQALYLLNLSLKFTHLLRESTDETKAVPSVNNLDGTSPVLVSEDDLLCIARIGLPNDPFWDIALLSAHYDFDCKKLKGFIDAYGFDSLEALPKFFTQYEIATRGFLALKELESAGGIPPRDERYRFETLIQQMKERVLRLSPDCDLKLNPAAEGRTPSPTLTLDAWMLTKRPAESATHPAPL